MTTMAIPFYAVDTEEVTDVFLGVVAHTVAVEELESFAPTKTDGWDLLISRSKCALREASPCSLQIYRNAQDKRSLCADPFPIGERAATRSGRKNLCSECYEH